MLDSEIDDLSFLQWLLLSTATIAVAMGVPLALFALVARGPKPARFRSSDGRLTLPFLPLRPSVPKFGPPARVDPAFLADALRRYGEHPEEVRYAAR